MKNLKMVDKQDLLDILLLIENCLNTSASKEGLIQRTNNYRIIKSKLLSILRLSEEELDDMYQKIDD
jgi:hypothetical protein